MPYENYGENLRTTRAREVFFSNYLRLIGFMTVKGVCKCIRN